MVNTAFERLQKYNFFLNDVIILKKNERCLFWSLHHEINSYGGEYDIWQPARHKR